LVDIADGDHLHARVAEETAQVVEPLVAGADDAEGDAFAGSGLIRSAETARREDQRRGQQGGGDCRGLGEELPARRSMSGHDIAPGVRVSGAGLTFAGSPTIRPPLLKSKFLSSSENERLASSPGLTSPASMRILHSPHGDSRQAIGRVQDESSATVDR